MSPPEVGSLHDAHRLADELRAGRDALLNLARDVSESRIYRVTARPGWTLKHELAALAASDAELLHVLDELRRRPTLPTGGLDLRRRFAESMHAMKELRLAELLDRLEADGARVAAAVRQHAQLLGRPLEVAGRDLKSMADLVHAHAERAREAVETFAGQAAR
jgi:hypothetical protein